VISGLSITSITPVSTGRLVALVNIKIGWLEITRFRISKTETGLTVLFPAEIEHDRKTARPSYIEILNMSDEKRSDLTAAILNAYEHR
jgi:DNA-binding cell septation regulator SpoVG